MTVRLSPNSSRAIHAARFGAELTRAMRERAVSNARLADATGTTKSAIANWKIGGNLPRTDTAGRLAEALHWPKLVDIARAGRSKPCERCGRPLVNEGGSVKRYCSVACRDVAEQLRRPSAGATLAAVVAEELERVQGTTRQVARRPLAAALAAYRVSDAKRINRVDKLTTHMAGIQAAVDAMCAGCEPEGLCRDEACALRPVSPLPMASLVTVDAIRQPEGAWHAAHRDKTLSAIRAGNAERWSREGERERQSDLHRARHAAKTPEERAAWREAISAGRRKAS